MKAKLASLLLLGMSMGLVGCQSVQVNEEDYKPQAYQNRDMNAPFEVTFDTTLNVLQEEGYVLGNVDRKNKMITGEIFSHKANKNWLLGINNVENRTKKMVATFDKLNDHSTKVRLNLVEQTAKSYNGGGDNASQFRHDSGRPVRDPEFYNRLLDEIEISVARRIKPASTQTAAKDSEPSEETAA